MNVIEEKLWNYIDGFCSDEEQKEIAHLIKTNPDYQKTYQELIALHSDFNLTELETPTMSFSNNIMRKIHLETSPLSKNLKADEKIIYSFFSFILVSITILIYFILKETSWSQELNKNIFGNLNFNIPPVSKSFLLYSFMIFDVILGLLICDKLIRSKKQS